MFSISKPNKFILAIHIPLMWHRSQNQHFFFCLWKNIFLWLNNKFNTTNWLFIYNNIKRFRFFLPSFNNANQFNISKLVCKDHLTPTKLAIYSKILLINSNNKKKSQIKNTNLHHKISLILQINPTFNNGAFVSTNHITRITRNQEPTLI